MIPADDLRQTRWCADCERVRQLTRQGTCGTCGSEAIAPYWMREATERKQYTGEWFNELEQAVKVAEGRTK